MVKRCAWGTCKSDSRYPERLIHAIKGTPVKFHHFPAESKDKERRETWIRACCRGDNFVCKKDSYICSLHFIGEEGPTAEYPDPISATTSKETVSIESVWCKLYCASPNMQIYCIFKCPSPSDDHDGAFDLSVCFNFYFNNTSAHLPLQVERLNRKRKSPTVRNSFEKRFRTVYDKLAAESLLLLSNTSQVEVVYPDQDGSEYNEDIIDKTWQTATTPTDVQSKQSRATQV